MTTKKLPKIPASEWMSLATGIAIFAIAEAVLFLNGYTSLMLNSVAALILASAMSYGIFAVKKKLKRIISAVNKLLTFMSYAVLAVIMIPMYLCEAVWFVLKAIPKIMEAIAKGLYAFCMKLPEYLGTLGLWIGILLLNLAMIPVLAIYLTIYGLVFALSGSTAKIMLKHYDAFGHKILNPIEKYISFELITTLIVLCVAAAIGAEILNLVSTADMITASNAANVTSNGGQALTAMATFSSYLPVFAIVVVAVAIGIALKYYLTGAAAYAAAAA